MRLSGSERRGRRDAHLVLAALLVGVVGLLSGCPDKKPTYPTCGGDKDCQEGERCINKRCQQCGDDSHCAPFEHCDKGACVLNQGACRTSGDCPDGVCKDNKCGPCQTDAECGPDRTCQNGRCLGRGACKVDEDCADDEDCIDGRCKREGRGDGDAGCRLEPVYFGFDNVGLDDAARTALNNNAECVQSVQGRGVLVIGHTDPRGTEEYNIALSENRAQTVGDYLARLGIDPARFRFVPKGETEATGSDESGWSQDRRVELEWQ
jgi:peptidoglycan-associated lipoprotein